MLLLCKFGLSKPPKQCAVKMYCTCLRKRKDGRIEFRERPLGRAPRNFSGGQHARCHIGKAVRTKSELPEALMELPTSRLRPFIKFHALFHYGSTTSGTQRRVVWTPLLQLNRSPQVISVWITKNCPQRSPMQPPLWKGNKYCSKDG